MPGQLNQQSLTQSIEPQAIVLYFMVGHPQLLAVTVVPTYWQLLLHEIYGSTDTVWSLDPATLNLME